MLKLCILHHIRLCGPRDSTSLRTFEFCNKDRRRSARLSHRHPLQAGLQLHGIEIELADFGVGIVEIQGVSGVTTMSCSSGTSLKQVIIL